MLQVCDTNAIRLATRCPRLGAVTTYRNAAAVLAACAAALSLAACSAGITSAPAAATAATSASHPSQSATASPSSAASRMIEVGGKVGRFPIPAGAKVGENISTSSEIGIMFAKVVPARVASFYAQALPTAGYTVTSNSSSSEGGGVVVIQFTGHGYTGEVSAFAKASADEALPGLGTRNITAIILQPKK